MKKSKKKVHVLLHNANLIGGSSQILIKPSEPWTFNCCQCIEHVVCGHGYIKKTAHI